MVEYIMKKEICGIFHGKCGTRDLTKVFGTVPRKAGRVVTLGQPPGGPLPGWQALVGLTWYGGSQVVSKRSEGKTVDFGNPGGGEGT
jgi:hypothetical protein